MVVRRASPFVTLTSRRRGESKARFLRHFRCFFHVLGIASMNRIRDGVNGVTGERLKERPQPGEATPVEPAAEAGPERKRVLLVEDTEADRDVYGALLWYNGYEVIHAADGADALAKAAASSPDLILMDIRLSGDLDGLEVARRVREEGLEVPILALSACSPDELGAALAEARLDGYLQKPIDPYAVVREVMRRIGESREPDRK
jgi:CheY-like chemotaxis protein